MRKQPQSERVVPCLLACVQEVEREVEEEAAKPGGKPRKRKVTETQYQYDAAMEGGWACMRSYERFKCCRCQGTKCMCFARDVAGMAPCRAWRRSLHAASTHMPHGKALPAHPTYITPNYCPLRMQVHTRSSWCGRCARR